LKVSTVDPVALRWHYVSQKWSEMFNHTEGRVRPPYNYPRPLYNPTLNLLWTIRNCPALLLVNLLKSNPGPLTLCAATNDFLGDTYCGCQPMPEKSLAIRPAIALKSLSTKLKSAVAQQSMEDFFEAALRRTGAGRGRE
jgi:hypothetical protein